MKAITKQRAIDLLKQGGYIQNMGYYENGRPINKFRVVMPSGYGYAIRLTTLDSILKTEHIERERVGDRMRFTMNKPAP